MEKYNHLPITATSMWKIYGYLTSMCKMKYPMYILRKGSFLTINSFMYLN